VNGLVDDLDGRAAEMPATAGDGEQQLNKAKKTKEEILEAKRRRSREWHAVWKKKGERWADNTQAGSSTGSGDLSTGSNTADSVRSAPASSQSSVDVAGSSTVGHKSGNLLSAMNAYVSKWNALSDLPPSADRKRKAYDAWMQSDERAALMATRRAVQ
jgi:hypothetical protein